MTCGVEMNKAVYIDESLPTQTAYNTQGDLVKEATEALEVLRLMKRGSDGGQDVFRVVNSPPGTPMRDIEDKIRELQYKYHIKDKNILQDRPHGWRRMETL
jgi:hypothetical protein